MDHQMQSLLSSWGLSQLISIFQGYKIDMKCFMNASDEYFQSIIPRELNIFQYFLNKRKQYIDMSRMYSSNFSAIPITQNSLNPHFNNVARPVVGDGLQNGIFSVNSFAPQIMDESNVYDDGKDSFIAFNQPQTNFPSNGSNLTSSSYISTPNQTRSSTISSSEENNHVAQQITPASVELSPVDHSQHQTGLVQETSPHDIALFTSPLNDQSNNNSPSLITTFHAYRNSYSQVQRNMSLYKLLEKSFYGRLILYNYSQNIEINSERLCQIAVDDILFKTIDGSLPLVAALTVPTNCMRELAESIQALLPKERAQLYYTAAHTLKTGERVNARGLLQDYWSRQVRQDLFKSQLKIDRTVSKKQPKKETQEVNLTQLCCEYTAKNKVEVISVWQESRTYRHEFLFVKQTAASIYEKLIVLRSDIALELISLDFIKLFTGYKSPEKAFFQGNTWDKFTSNWPAISKKIIAYLESKQVAKQNLPKKRKISAIDTTKESSATIQPAKYPTSNEAHTQILALTLLHTLLGYTPHPPKRSTASSTVEPESEVEIDENSSANANETVAEGNQPLTKANAYSKLNIEASFIRHLEVKPKEKLENFLKSESDCFERQHAYVLVIGPLVDIKESYVVFQDCLYECDSPTEAVDFCFKWFFALNQKYPHNCQHIWSFLQVYVYEIDAKKKKPVALNAVYKIAKAL